MTYLFNYTLTEADGTTKTMKIRNKVPQGYSLGEAWEHLLDQSIGHWKKLSETKYLLLSDMFGSLNLTADLISHEILEA